MIREWEGLPLCSTRDPQSEASRWLSTITPTADHCWVLGLGSGYHVQALAQKYRNLVISVIDHREPLRKSFEDKFPQLRSQVLVEIVRSEEELLMSKSFALFGQNQSSNHIFRPAVQKVDELYLLFSKSLRGQTRQSFLVLMDMFGIEISTDALNGIHDFQIKEISKSLAGRSEKEEQRIIRVLRELVS